MKKITSLAGLLVIIFLAGGSVLRAQGSENVNPDSVLPGGLYRFVMIDGKDFLGEITRTDSMSIQITTGSEFRNIAKKEIRSIQIPAVTARSKYLMNTDPVFGNENKFRMLAFARLSVNLPMGDWKSNYNTGFGFQFSIYHLFDRTIGLGEEFQYDNFGGRTINMYNYNSSQTGPVELGGVQVLALRTNLIAGNLQPEAGLIFYGLFGLGIGLNIFSAPSSPGFSYYYGPESSTETNFVYGIGIGSVFKISKGRGINLDIQYNKLTAPPYYGGSGEGMNGCFSISAGIIFTPF